MIWGRPFRPTSRQGAFGTAHGAPAHRRALPCLACLIMGIMSYLLHAYTYLRNGYLRALASSDLVRYDMGQAMPTHITTGRLWYRLWRVCPSPCLACLTRHHHRCRIFSRAWMYLSNGYMRALASSYLVRYGMGKAMPTNITTGRLWYRPWRTCPSPCFATLSMPHEHHLVFSHVHART